MKKLLICAGLAVLSLTACGFSHGGKLVEDTYTVKEGDTLWSISAKYMEKNTYGPRDIREFMSGIVELNYDQVFKRREPALIYPGEELKISYWVTKEG